MTKVFRFVIELIVRGFHLLHFKLEVKKRIKFTDAEEHQKCDTTVKEVFNIDRLTSKVSDSSGDEESKPS